MVTTHAYKNLGHTNYGWLDARYHFSFASYYNPNRMGFGVLRVINDDVIKAGSGFDTHSHKNMEIITYVRKGAITHKDSNGNIGRTVAGDVQIMSAGAGISHSEFNYENEDTSLYQIWIEPNRLEVSPRWDSYEFPKIPTTDELSLLVSGNGSAPLTIHQDAFIYAGHLLEGTQVNQKVKHQAYILVSEGKIEIEGELLNEGDGLEVKSISSINIKAQRDSKVLVIDVPQS